jgi:hypothetical protein
VVVCDNKVVLQDIITKKVQELPKALFDGKSPTCLEFLFRGGQYAPGPSNPLNNLLASPVLAFGCSDGGVRLVSLDDLRVCGRAGGCH